MKPWFRAIMILVVRCFDFQKRQSHASAASSNLSQTKKGNFQFYVTFFNRLFLFGVLLYGWFLLYFKDYCSVSFCVCLHFNFHFSFFLYLGEGADPATDSVSGVPKTAGEQTVKSEPPTATSPQPPVVDQSSKDLWVHWHDFTQAFKLVNFQPSDFRKMEHLFVFWKNETPNRSSMLWWQDFTINHSNLS